MSQLCPKCDQPTAPDMRFCASCGTSLGAKEPQAALIDTLARPSAPVEQRILTSAPVGAPIFPQDNFAAPPVQPQQIVVVNTGAAGVPSFGAQVNNQFQRTSTNAILCFASAIAGWSILPIIGAILAIIFGRQARREIRESNGMVGGGALVTIGMVIGSIELGLLAVGVCGAMALFGLQAGAILLRVWLTSS